MFPSQEKKNILKIWIFHKISFLKISMNQTFEQCCTFLHYRRTGSSNTILPNMTNGMPRYVELYFAPVRLKIPAEVSVARLTVTRARRPSQGFVRTQSRIEQHSMVNERHRARLKSSGRSDTRLVLWKSLWREEEVKGYKLSSGWAFPKFSNSLLNSSSQVAATTSFSGLAAWR